MKHLLQCITICVLFLLHSNASISQLNYYWVGGGGDWGDLSHWANTSGGLGSVYGYPPSPTDNVFFDQNSGFTATSNTVTTPSYSGITVRNMTWSNAPNNPVFDENPGTDFVVLGNLVLQQNMTFRAQVLMMGNANATITSNGARIGGALYIDKANASVTLNDSLVLYHVNANQGRSGAIIHTNGTFNLNGHNLYAGAYITYGSNTCHINADNSKLFFKNPIAGNFDSHAYYYDNAGIFKNTTTSFTITGTNKSISAVNADFEFYNTYSAMDLRATTNYNLYNIKIHSTYWNQVNTGYESYTGSSYLNNAKIRRFQTTNVASQGVETATGAEIDSLLIGDNPNAPQNANFAIKANGTIIHYSQAVGSPMNTLTSQYVSYFRFLLTSTAIYNTRFTYNLSANSVLHKLDIATNQATISDLFTTVSLTTANSIVHDYTSIAASTTNLTANSHLYKAHFNKYATYKIASSISDTLISESKTFLNVTANGQSKYARINSEGTVTGANGVYGYLYIHDIGKISANTSTFRFAEYNINGWLEGTNNIFDTLVFSPGYTYRMGNGVSNTVRNRWYASGNPCYFTEVYNVGASGTATINLLAGVPNNFDYIRFWGVVGAGAASPIQAGIRSIDIANNSNIVFAPYSPLEVLHPFGVDTIVACNSDFPFTLNTNGFYGNTNTSFTWQDGSTLDHYVVTAPGVYTAAANYGRNCFYSATVTVVDQLTTAITETTPGSGISCNPNSPNGSLTANTSGYGSGPYTYSWNTTPAQTTQSIANLPIGTYTVTVTDADNCVSTATAIIEGPAQPITVTAPTVFADCDPSTNGTGYIQTAVTGGTAPYTYAWNTTPVQTTSFADNLEQGVYEVIVTDSLGCSSLPLSVTVGTSSSSLTANVGVIQPLNCDLFGSATVFVTGDAPPHTYQWSHDAALTSNNANNIPVGTNYVLVSDNNNCADNLTIIINSPDSIPPTFANCPTTTTIYAQTSCDAVVNWTAPQVTDNCGTVTVVSDYSIGDVFSVGTTPVTYTATDIFGNSSTCAFDVVVIDTISPVFYNVIPDIIIQANSGNCTATATWPTPVVLDNCAIDSISSDFSSGATFPIGTTTVTMTAVDIHGNSSVITFKVIVHAHNTNFNFASSCPNNTTIALQSTEPNACATNYTVPMPNITSTCGTYWAVTGLGLYTGGQTYSLPIGQNLITQKYTNGADTLTCSYVVTVVDNQGPVFDATAPHTYSPNGNWLYVDADTCGGYRLNYIMPSFIDNCAIDTIWANIDSGTLLNYGNHYLTFYAKDIYGNQSSFTIYMYVQTPTVQFSNVPGNIIAQQTTCFGAPVSWDPPTVNLPCYTVTSTHTPGSNFPVGSTMVLYTFTDDQGNTFNTSFYVLVNSATPTVNNCPTNQSYSITGTQCTAVATWTAPTFTTPCVIDSVVSNYQSGASFPIGTTQVVYTAYLENGTTMNCTFFVTVFSNTANNITVTDCPPSPQTFYINPAQSCDSTLVNWTVPTFNSSPCFPAIDSVALLSAITNNSLVATGTYPVEYVALNDNGGQLANCAFTVIVIDTTSTIQVSNCPTVAQIVYIDPLVSCTEAPIIYNTPVFTPIGCAPQIANLTTNTPSGTMLTVGSHTITVNAIDQNNAIIATCSFSAEVIDTSSEVVLTCPGTFSSLYNAQVFLVEMDPATCSAVATWSDPTYNTSGTCSPTISYVNQVSGPPSGVTLTANNASHYITYTAYDINGTALASCEFIVGAELNDSLITGLIGDTIIFTNATTCLAPFTWDLPEVLANCGTTVVSIQAQSENWVINNLSPMNNQLVQQFPVGVYEVSYMLNTSGVYTSANMTITVVDGTIPDFGITCPTDTIVRYTSYNTCEAVANWPAPVALSGNCTNNQPLPVVTNYMQGATLPFGITNVYYTASTPAGSTTCNIIVNVIDTIAPRITACPPTMTVTLTNNSCVEPIYWTTPIVIDNCFGATMTSSHNSSDSFPIGTTTVTYTAIDQAGLQDQCIFVITVVDPHDLCNGGGNTGNDDIKIPDAFTPDGDGVNDALVITGIEKFPENEIVIFNRWGTEVYRMKGYNNTWDGKMNVGNGLEGGDLPTGTYFYILDTNTIAVGVKKGYVYLQR